MKTFSKLGLGLVLLYLVPIAFILIASIGCSGEQCMGVGLAFMYGGLPWNKYIFYFSKYFENISTIGFIISCVPFILNTIIIYVLGYKVGKFVKSQEKWLQKVLKIIALLLVAFTTYWTIYKIGFVLYNSKVSDNGIQFVKDVRDGKTEVSCIDRQFKKPGDELCDVMHRLINKFLDRRSNFEGIEFSNCQALFGPYSGHDRDLNRILSPLEEECGQFIDIRMNNEDIKNVNCVTDSCKVIRAVWLAAPIECQTIESPKMKKSCNDYAQK